MRYPPPPVTQQQPPATAMMGGGNPGGSYPWAEYWYIGGYPPCVYTFYGNCVVLDPIVIKPNLDDDLFGASSGGAVAVKSLFLRSDYQDICNEMGPEATSRLQSGDYVIKVTDNNEQCIAFIADSATVSKDKFDFAVQINK